MRLKYSEEALNDLDEILVFIAKESPARAVSFIEEIKEKIELLLDFPALGVSCQSKGIPANCRVMIFGTYLIFYSIAEEDILILSIINAAKDHATR